MKRNMLDERIKWKNDEERKPLVLRGARQVGKTWLRVSFYRHPFMTFYKALIYTTKVIDILDFVWYNMRGDKYAD